MKLFLDTGNIKDIETYCAIGIIDGVTTNPSLMAKEAGDPRAITKRICQIVKGPVSAEVLATDVEGMIREGRDLATIDPHVVIKVPFGKAGVQACKTLRAEGIRVNVTLVFSAAQALLAAKAGATLREPVRRAASTTSRPTAWSSSSRSSRSTATTGSRPRCSWRASGTRCTSWRRPAWAPTSAPARPR